MIHVTNIELISRTGTKCTRKIICILKKKCLRFEKRWFAPGASTKSDRVTNLTVNHPFEYDNYRKRKRPPKIPQKKNNNDSSRCSSTYVQRGMQYTRAPVPLPLNCLKSMRSRNDAQSVTAVCCRETHSVAADSALDDDDVVWQLEQQQQQQEKLKVLRFVFGFSCFLFGTLRENNSEFRWVGILYCLSLRVAVFGSMRGNVNFSFTPTLEVFFLINCCGNAPQILSEFLNNTDVQVRFRLIKEKRGNYFK